MRDFWTDMSETYVVESAIDQYLQERKLEGSGSRSIRELTDAYRSSQALSLPQLAGTRVRFVANLGSILSYTDMPDPDSEGTIVTVRSGSGDVTALDERTFVLWDDGKFRPILAEHLRLANASKRRAYAVRLVVGDLGDLSSLFVSSSSSDDLVHKATKDLWAVKKQGENFVIERLFTESGKPLKI